MSHPTFGAEARSQFGSKAAQQFRKQGKVPLTISRSGQDSQHVLVSATDAQTIRGLVSRVVILKLEDSEVEILVKNSTTDPLTDHILHLDGLAVTDDQVVKVAVPVVPDLKTDCPGIKAGGLLEQMMRRVVIKIPAGKIPESLRVDLTGISLGQTMYAENAQLPEGAKLITKPRTAMLTIIKTRGMRRAEATTEEG
jgi:large subunit ribosomal protein L25